MFWNVLMKHYHYIIIIIMLMLILRHSLINICLAMQQLITLHLFVKSTTWLEKSQ